MRPAIESLLGYPYGCVEQTTSRCLAILAAPALLADAGRAEAARDMIRVGIDRLASMQTPDGGLAYWPGDTRPDRFGTGYAAGFLAAAARAGHEVPAYLKDGIAKYLKRELDRVGAGAPDGNERALFCRVLAAFGRPPEGWMEKLAESVGDLDTAGRAALAGAFLDAGRRDRALSVISEDTLGLTVPASFSGRLSSQVSGEASLLSTLLDLDPSHAWVPVLAKRLDDARTGGGWRTTSSTTRR